MGEDAERRIDLTELSTNVAVIASEMKNNNDMTKELHTAVLGEKGLVSRVAVVEEVSSTNKKVLSWHTKVLYGLAGTGTIGGIVGSAIAAIKYLG